MPGVDFQAVRSMVSMAQVLERIGFVPTECSGGQVRGPRPVGSQMVTAVCAGPQDWNGDQRRGTRTLPRPGKRRFTHRFWRGAYKKVEEENSESINSSVNMAGEYLIGIENCRLVSFNLSGPVLISGGMKDVTITATGTMRISVGVRYERKSK